MKISQRLPLLFVVGSLVPLAGVSVFFYQASSTAIQQQVDRQLQSVLSRQVNALATINAQNQAILSEFGFKVQLRLLLQEYLSKPSTALKTQIQDIEQGFMNEHPTLLEVTIADPAGRVITSTNSALEGADMTGSEVYKAAQKVASTTIFGNGASSNNEYVNLAKVLSIQNKAYGTALLKASTNAFVSVTQNYDLLGSTGETFFLREEPTADQFLTNVRFNQRAALTLLAKPEREALHKAPKDQTFIFRDYRGQATEARAQSVPSTDWLVVVKIDSAEIFAALYHLRNLMIIFSVVAIGAAFTLSWWFSALITRPLSAFLNVVKQIQNGDLKQRAAVKSRDEIGHLAAAFNEMTDKLNRYYKELEAKVKERTKALESARLQLQKSVKQDEALLASIGDSVMATDKDGSIIWINKSAEEMLALDAASVLGKRYDSIWRLESEAKKPIPPGKEPIHQTLVKGQPVQNMENYYVRKDAKGNVAVRFAVAVNVAPVVLDGKLTGTIVVFRDITHEREVDRMKTEFISLASHQLRTPLSAINWFSEMLLAGDAGKLTSEQQEYTQNIAESTQRMTDLVSSLLNISRIESGRIMIEPKPTDLAKLVGGIVVDLKGKTEAKKQQLIVSVHKDLPKVNIDPQLIGQVYLNLLTNAIKYTPKGGEISVIVSRRGEELLSQVSDNGYGIPKAEQARVFQKFFRATNIVKIETDGTGLGMYLVKSIIESSGGKIWFKSEVGKGTTFWFTLPMAGMKAKEGEVTLDAARGSR